MSVISHKTQPGFTLLEVIVALGIFTLFVGTVIMLFSTGYSYNLILWEQLATQNDGRKALRVISDDVRRAEESSIGSYPLATVGEYELILYANVDDDVARERVRYYVDNLTLYRGVVQPAGSPLSYTTSTEVSTEVAQAVVNVNKGIPVFLYFNEAFTGTQSPMVQPVDITSVRIIKTQLELEADPTQSPVPLHVETYAHIRNLKTN